MVKKFLLEHDVFILFKEKPPFPRLSHFEIEVLELHLHIVETKTCSKIGNIFPHKITINYNYKTSQISQSSCQILHLDTHGDKGFMMFEDERVCFQKKKSPDLQFFVFVISILVLQKTFLVINYHNFWMVLDFQLFIYLHVFLNLSQTRLSKLEFLI